MSLLHSRNVPFLVRLVIAALILILLNVLCNRLPALRNSLMSAAESILLLFAAWQVSSFVLQFYHRRHKVSPYNKAVLVSDAIRPKLHDIT